MENVNNKLSHEAWDKAYKMITLENKLCNHRVTTIMAINGFLFLAFIFLINCLIRMKTSPIPDVHLHNISISIVLAINAILCVVGVTSSWSIREGINAAYLQVIEAAKWLDESAKNPSKLLTHPYPPITGKKLQEDDYKMIANLSSGNLIIPKLLIYVWVCFFIINFFFALKLHTN